MPDVPTGNARLALEFLRQVPRMLAVSEVQEPHQTRQGRKRRRRQEHRIEDESSTEEQNEVRHPKTRGEETCEAHYTEESDVNPRSRLDLKISGIYALRRTMRGSNPREASTLCKLSTKCV